MFDKKISGSRINNENIPSKELPQELQKISPFLDNIWSADLGNTQLISKFNKGFIFLLCVIDIFS